MSKTLATVFSVELNVPTTKRDGGTYSAAKISYQEKGTDGSVGKIKTSTTNMVFLAKNPVLQSKIFGLTNADLPTDVVIVQEQQGNFTNLTDILSVEEANPAELTATIASGAGGYTQSAAPKSSGVSKKDTDDKSASINRAVALKAAVEFMATTESTPSKIIEVSKVLEGYLRGE